MQPDIHACGALNYLASDFQLMGAEIGFWESVAKILNLSAFRIVNS